MPSLTTYEEQDEVLEHGDDPDQEIRYVEIDGEELEASIVNGQIQLKEVAPATKTKAKSVRIKVICSCGSYQCGAIGAFGHPDRTVYEPEIKPLPTQWERDQLARRLKMGG